jgi:hypothetical protein
MAKMAEVKLVPEVIKTMAKGKSEDRVKCPVCGLEKDPDKWICETCFKEHGFDMIEEVQRAVRRAANKVAPEIWEKLLEVARGILSDSEQPKGLKDSDLVAILKLSLNGVPEGAIFAALATARKDMKTEADAAAKEAAREAEREARWRDALAAVEEKFSEGENIVPAFFVKNPVRFNGGFISDRMMKAACAQVREERRRAEKSQMAAALVKKHIRRFNFSDVSQSESAVVPV